MSPEELQATRIAVGLSQEALARELGVSVSAVSKWEAGVRPIGALATRAVSGVFDDALDRALIRLYRARHKRPPSRREESWLHFNRQEVRLYLPAVEVLDRANRDLRYLNALFKMPLQEKVAATERALERYANRNQAPPPAQPAPRKSRPAEARARSRAPRRPARRARGTRTSRGGEGEGDGDGPPSPEPDELRDRTGTAGSRGRALVPFELVNETSDRPVALAALYPLMTDLLVRYALKELDRQ